MDSEHVDNLRNPYHETEPGLPLVLYLDLPVEEVQHWQKTFCTVLALNRRLSKDIKRLLEEAADDETDGLQDNAAGAFRLLLSFGVKWQAASAPLLEGLMLSFEILAPDGVIEPQGAEPTDALPPATDVLDACESWLRQNGEPS